MEEISISLKDTISGFKIFEGLSSEELDHVLPLCCETNFKAKDVILEEDSKGSDIYIVLEGRVNVEIKTSSSENYEKESKHLSTLREGDVFGEISFLEGGRRSARIFALDEIRALKIDGKKLYGLLNEDNHIGFLIMRNIGSILAQRLFSINFKWRDNI